VAQVELQAVSKVYPGGIEAVSGVDLTIDDGVRLVIVGPSGSGKSTLLRLIAGLERLSSGSVRIDGRRVDELPPHARDVAMVFQNPALYPHLRIADNLAFGLRARRRPRAEVRERVAAVAGQLGLTELLDRWPQTLSGGQRQRVALGRAIVRRPSVFLFDEPFSSLDAPLRAALRGELLDVHRALGMTMVHVTHDQGEALALGEQVAMMNRGRIVQVGSPRDIYDRPAHRFVGQFVGDPPMSILPCKIAHENGTLRLRPLGGPDETGWVLPEGAHWAEPARRRGPGRIDLGLRPEHLALLAVPGESPAEPHVLPAAVEVRRLEPRGYETLATLALGPHTLGLRLAARTSVQENDRVMVGLDLTRAAWFDADTGAAL
jgi:ABC-type sugar transport system ATPase subunit